MREILFRGKTAVGGEWVQGFYSCTNECYMYVQGQLLGICIKRNPKNIHFITPFTNTDGIITPLNFINVIPETVGQYTYLTDKNNTLIFEGDIIRYKANECCDICIVKWDITAGRFAVYGLGLGENSPLGDFVFYDPLKCEVIGNIYDNPELLKEDNAEILCYQQNLAKR